MRRLRIYFWAWVLALIGSMAFVGVVQAAPATQQSPTAAGIAFTPAIQDKVLGPSDHTTSFDVVLSNQTDKTVTYSLSSDDFNALNQTGGLAFLGSDISNVTSGHGLSSILKLANHIVTLPADSSKTITARISDVAMLAPGGHYAAILAQALPDGTSDNGNRVTINQVLSSLVFLETAGQGTKTLTLLRPSVNSVSFDLPSSVNLVFKATGNTQTIPRGIVTLSRGNTEVSRGMINENSSLLLPGSTRLLPTALMGGVHPWLPGMYTLKVQYRYDGSLGITTYQKTFLYINVQIVLLTALLVIVLLFGAYRGRRWLWARARRVLAGYKSGIDTTKKRLIIVRDVSHAGHKITVVKKGKK